MKHQADMPSSESSELRSEQVHVNSSIGIGTGGYVCVKESLCSIVCIFPIMIFEQLDLHCIYSYLGLPELFRHKTVHAHTQTRIHTFPFKGLLLSLWVLNLLVNSTVISSTIKFMTTLLLLLYIVKNWKKISFIVTLEALPCLWKGFTWGFIWGDLPGAFCQLGVYLRKCFKD